MRIALFRSMRQGVPLCATTFVFSLCALLACSSRVTGASSSPSANIPEGGSGEAAALPSAPPKVDGSAPNDGGKRESDAACLQLISSCEFYTPYKCEKGLVSAIIDPCAKCGPSNWQPVHTCRSGCRIDYQEIVSKGDWIPWSSQEELCEETRPKHAGDPCRTRGDCAPSNAAYTNGVYVPPEYLLCSSGVCVSTSPPVIRGWMNQFGCGEGVDAPSGTRVVPARNCGDGLCLLTDEVNGCRPQTCTALCTSDQDCPSESSCGYFPDGLRACKPGYPPNDVSALRCPRGPVDGG
jgi:hypothetical protein